MLCEFYNENLEYQENILAKYYIKYNHEVTIVTSTFDSIFDFYDDKSERRNEPRTYSHNGAKIIKLNYVYNLFNKLRKFTSISRILIEEKPDLIFIHDIIPNMLEAIQYKKRHPSCRIIMDYHADYTNSAHSWISLNILHKIIRKKFFLDPCKKYLDKIFPIVPASANFLHEVYGIPYNEMELLPLGADTDTAAMMQSDLVGIEIRKQYKIPADHIVIFTGGKLRAIKRVEVLIEAIQQIANPKLHLFIVGEASAEDQSYKEFLLELSKGNNQIYFTGWVSSKDIYKYLDASDIAVFPSSQSVLWQQSISMGLPMIVGNLGNQSIDYLNLYDNMIILDTHEINRDILAEKINILIENPELIKKMSLGANQMTKTHLDWNQIILKTLD